MTTRFSLLFRLKKPKNYTKGNKLVYKATVPPNTTATLYLPAASIQKITESGNPIAAWKDVSIENGMVTIPLTSGNYTFAVLNK